MSTEVDNWTAFCDRLKAAHALLLDFDGPVCSVFSGLPSHVVAEQLRETLSQAGYATLPNDVRETADPFDVLYYAATLGPDETCHVEAAFTAHECEAIQTAQPTPGAHEMIQRWSSTGRPLAIVSNNSHVAIEAYLSLHNLERQVAVIAARDFIDPSRLKPSPYLVQAALSRVGVKAERAVFFGDSLSDISAGRAAGVVCGGFANKVHKIPAFSSIVELIITRWPAWGRAATLRT